MTRFRPTPTWKICAAALLVGSSPLGCAFGRLDHDIDRTPVVNTGVGATILYPGQTAPSFPPSAPTGATARPGAAPSGSTPYGAPPDPPGARAPQAAPGAQPQGVSAPNPGGRVAASSSGSPTGGKSVTLIGGAETDEVRHTKYREDPSWFKYATLPFALIAAPFVWVADAIRGDQDTGPELPRASAPPPRAAPPPPRPDYETRQMQGMERELDERQARERGAGATLAGVSGPNTARAEPGALSIAEELAALQRAPTLPAPSGSAAAEPVRVAHAEPDRRPPAWAPGAAADGIVDRDGDGRIDQWIFRENGEIVREALDENFDSRPDRTLHYDRETHQVCRVEEDTNHDGVVDSWTDYQNGAVVRRRADADRDGIVDTWSFYRDGEIARHEQDTTGDGFRDRIGFFANGRLAREEQDDDGDGRPDVTSHFDENERIVRREEDLDGDGRVDVISHYDQGHLTTRELLDEAALSPEATSPPPREPEQSR